MAGGRLAVNATVFAMQWDDLQVNTPNPFAPGQFCRRGGLGNRLPVTADREEQIRQSHRRPGRADGDPCRGSEF